MSNKHLPTTRNFSKCTLFSVIRARQAIQGNLYNCTKLLHYSRGFIPFTQPSSSQRLRNALTLRYILNLLKLYLIEVEQTILLFHTCDKFCFEPWETENQETVRGHRFQMRRLIRNDFFINYVKNLKREVKTVFFKYLDEPEDLLDSCEMQSKLEFRLKLLQVAVIVLKKEICLALKMDDEYEHENENQLCKFSHFHTSFPMLTLALTFDSVCYFF